VSLTLPPQAIQPLRERLVHLRAEHAKLAADPNGPDFGHAGERGRLVRSISETEALIKRLEKNDDPRRS
jgi:hypothetical protein